MLVRTISKILAVALLFLAGAVRLSASTEDVTIRFRFGKAETDFSKLEQILTGPDSSRIAKIELRATSSPDGPYWVNKQLAQDRAARVIDKVKELCPSIGEDMISTKVIAEDWSGVAAWLRRCKKAYKDEAIKIVTETPAAEREAKLQDLWAGEAWEDMMRSAFPALRSVRVTITYTDPEPEPVAAEVSLETPADSGTVKIMFAAGMRYLQPDLGNNAAAFAELDKMAESGMPLRIESWTSPEGDPTSNRALARNRLNCLLIYLKENFGLQGGSIISEVKGEDWDGLYREAAASYKEKNRDKVLEILGNKALTGGQKKAAVRGLDGGATWRYLIKNQMPSLRYVAISNVPKAEAE